MILILGGTTEGRIAIQTLDDAGAPFFYSTRGDSQKVDTSNGILLSGILDENRMLEFCRSNSIKLIVDAAHPFASHLHANAIEAARKADIPIIRFERIYPPRNPNAIWCDDYDDALRRMTDFHINRLLALTGVQTIEKLKPFWSVNDTYFRILDRDESRCLADKCGFPAERLLYYNPSVPEATYIRNIRPTAIITKESGLSGGFEQKLDAAFAAKIKVFVIKRPQLPIGYAKCVNGRHGLRLAVESILPDFYPLKSGITTGACATAAAKAAALTLLTGDVQSEVSITLPDDEEITIPINSVSATSNSATASVIKNAGDDPDVTNGCEIIVELTPSFKSNDVEIFGGEGVGIVTLPGLNIAIGESAINPTPKAMITRELKRLMPDNGVKVTISVTNGRELAERTFNSRIGIVGGISIIGTSGIVKPFSHQAFIDAIQREIEVAIAIGTTKLVLNSGAKSERVLTAKFPELPRQAFIHYGNAIGESLALVHRLGISEIALGLMIGKAVKLAEGHPDTHSHKATMNRQFLMDIAAEANCSRECIIKISEINMARQLWDIIPNDDADEFYSLLLDKCLSVCRRHYPSGHLQLFLIDDLGEIRYDTDNALD